MKVGIAQVALSHGGAERVGVLLANGLYQRGHQVSIYTDLNEAIVYPTDEGVRIVDFVGKPSNKIWKWIKATYHLRKIIKRERPDVIIGIMGLCTLVTYIACLGLRVRVVMTEHNSFERPASAPMPQSLKIFKFWINKLYKHVTVLTEADKKVIGNRLRHVTVMPNPLLLKPVEDIPQKDKTVLAAGRVDAWHYKGFDALVRTWKNLQKFNDDDNLRAWWLKIAGDGKKESFEYLTGLLPDGEWACNEDENLDDEHKEWLWKSEKYHIEFLGFQKDMETLYQKSEIFVLSSRYEGFGLVLIEAMSQGCAPVASDYKGRQAEILYKRGERKEERGVRKEERGKRREERGGDIEITKNGILCEPDNVEALASALEKMMGDEEYRHQVQRAAVERSMFYDMNHTMDRWEAYLNNEVLSKKKA